MEKRFDAVETRLDRVETEMDKRFNAVGERLDSLDSKVTEQFRRLEATITGSIST